MSNTGALTFTYLLNGYLVVCIPNFITRYFFRPESVLFYKYLKASDMFEYLTYRFNALRKCTRGNRHSQFDVG